MWPWDLNPFKITLEEPRVTIQETGRSQSPTWYYLTFSGKLYPSQISMVGVDNQKGKTVLFKFKVLIKVNFKI
jgi:hypothetical protein